MLTRISIFDPRASPPRRPPVPSPLSARCARATTRTCDVRRLDVTIRNLNNWRCRAGVAATPTGRDIVLGKLGGGGDLIPAALRWLRRRGSDAEPFPTSARSEPVAAPSADVATSSATADTQTASLEIATPTPLPTADDVQELRELVEMHRNDPKLRWQLGLALVAARKLNLALAHLEVAASQDATLDQGELADVREAQRAERQVRRYPRDPELHLTLGRLYLALDQGDAALAELEEAARLNP